MPEPNDVIAAPDEAKLCVEPLANVDGQFVLRISGMDGAVRDSGILYVHYDLGQTAGWRPVWFTEPDLQNLRASIDATLRDRDECIAALAPELLAGLRDVTDWLGHLCISSTPTPWLAEHDPVPLWERLRALVARAEGEASRPPAGVSLNDWEGPLDVDGEGQG
jgi:hypothetical protein